MGDKFYSLILKFNYLMDSLKDKMNILHNQSLSPKLIKSGSENISQANKTDNDKKQLNI